MSQKPTYSAGVMGGYAADALAVIQRNYLKRFPIDLPHNEEPTEEWLASVNDEGPDPDQVPPDIESLSNEDYIAATKELEERQKLLAFRKAVSEILVWFVLFVLKGFQANQTLACVSVHEGPRYRPSRIWRSQSIPDPAPQVNGHFHAETATESTCKCLAEVRAQRNRFRSKENH